jgi:hypothetical protein
MATTLLPIDPALSPQRANRIPTISASLLPEETLAARRARRARRWAIVAVLLVAVGCGAWFVAARQDKAAALAELDRATATAQDLQREQNKYSPAVQVQNEITTLTGQLQATMANDLNWAALFALIRRTGTPSDTRINDVSGRLNDAEDGTVDTTGSLPGTGSVAPVGDLTIIGTAPDKAAVAAFVDALAKQKLLANPYVTSVTTDEKGVRFSLTVDITPAARCGRFTGECKPTGGK